jgi:saccharopine dehydrogenase-like NADP-dependent oxidoreductase
MKHVLVLGAGRVARPCVAYLQKQEWIKITVADAIPENLERVAGSHPRTTTLVRDLGKHAAEVIASVKPDLVINLLPPAFKAQILDQCLKAGTSLVHPSYSDAASMGLDAQVKAAGITFLYELGLDPGIDHMSAARTINQVHGDGGQVESFTSTCGAIPSAEANTNPWGYKLSWAPDSLIGASLRHARILVNGEIKDWPDGQTFQHVDLEEVDPLGWYEVYANADSTPYLKTYGIPEATSIFRGTIRYPGWCETIVAMNKLGLFLETPEDFGGLSFRGFLARKCGSADPARAEAALCARLGIETSSAVFLRLKWLGFFEDRPIPFASGSSRDIIRLLYTEKLVFLPQERDLVILKDEVVASYAATGKRLRHTSMLIDFGIPGGDSSVARTTGIPPAIAARFILEGVIKSKGVLLPTMAEVYNPVLAELEKEGIRLVESASEF